MARLGTAGREEREGRDAGGKSGKGEMQGKEEWEGSKSGKGGMHGREEWEGRKSGKGGMPGDWPTEGREAGTRTTNICQERNQARAHKEKDAINK